MSSAGYYPIRSNDRNNVVASLLLLSTGASNPELVAATGGHPGGGGDVVTAAPVYGATGVWTFTLPTGVTFRRIRLLSANVLDATSTMGKLAAVAAGPPQTFEIRFFDHSGAVVVPGAVLVEIDLLLCR